MLSPEYLKGLPDNIVQIFEKLEESILADISRRISKGIALTETADYQISVLYELGYDLDEIKKEIAKTVDKSVVEVEKILGEASLESYHNDMDFYKVGGKKLPPLQENIAMVNFIQGVIDQTKGEFYNLTRTMGFVEGRNFKVLTDMYIDTLNYATFQLSSGAFDHNTILRQSVKKLADSGVRFIDYDSGIRNHVDVAVRRALMTGVSQITGHMSLANADMMGQDLMEITAHMGARPDHQAWQGQIVSRSGREGYLSLDDIGYGTGPGFKGWNCRHDWFPYFEGISERAYTEKQLKNIDPPPFEYDGRVYTAYEASQKQRQIERSIRKTKRELIVYNNAGLKDDFTAASIKLRRQREFYEDFSKAANLREKVERTGVYGYNKSISSKSVWAVKKEKEKYAKYHYNKDGIIVVTDDKTNKIGFKVGAKAEPYTVLDTKTRKGAIDRTIYDNEGKMIKQINTHNHGNPKKHPYGTNGEHAHDIIWEDDKIVGRPARGLTDKERKEHGDIL